MKKSIVSFLVYIISFTSFICLFSINSTTVSGDTIYVDDDGGQDFSSIQEAINAASIGDTVYVDGFLSYDCPNLCGDTSVCLINNTIGECDTIPVDTIYYEGCGGLYEYGGCLLLFPETGQFLFQFLIVQCQNVNGKEN